MKLSRESEYGLEGLKVLARQPLGKIMVLQRIAALGALPERFLAKIFQKLSRHNIVHSHRGVVRGYSLARPPRSINLREVLEAIEGRTLLDQCLFWSSRCDPEGACSLHEQWIAIRTKLQHMLEATTLEQIASRPSTRSKMRRGPGRSADSLSRAGER
jgi:Rrf2 family protein